MYEKLHDSLLANDDIHFFDEDFSKVTLYATQIGILGVDLNKINFDDDNNFFEDDTDTITHVRLLAWCNKLEKCKIKSWCKQMGNNRVKRSGKNAFTVHW